jgi:hypothetical protein
MKFNLEFKMDNAAFADEPLAEAAGMLDEISAKLRDGDFKGTLFDVNGNKIGQWEIAD